MDIESMSIQEQIDYHKAEIAKLIGGEVCEYCGNTKVYSGGLCKSCYERNRRNGTPEYKQPARLIPKETEKAVKPIIPWRNALAQEVVKEHFVKPEDFEESVDRVMSMLKESERDIIIKRLDSGLSWSEIAKIRGVTRQRPPQIYSRAIEKLRKKYYTRYFTIGIKNMKEMDTAEMEIGDKVSVEMKIDDFPLSNRAKNCLKRAGIKTTKELEPYLKNDGKWLMSVRWCGNKTVEDILEVMKPYMEKYA